MDIRKNDVVVLQMDDELIIVDSVAPDDDTFLVLDSQKSPSGVTFDFYHEYKISEVMTVYREVK